MATVQDIEEEIKEINSLQILTQAYEEIASTRMKKVRTNVLSKRDFLQEIYGLFEEVRSSYARQVQALAKRRGGRGGNVTFLGHNGKTVTVFLSANTGLYGDIINKTFRIFLEDIRNSSSEVTIVGRHGLGLFLAEEPNRPYTFFDLPDYNPSSKELSTIIKHIVQYEQIKVYYGRFVNVVTQKPSVYTISAQIDIEKEAEKKPKLYLFEPSLEEILMFFEKEIFASLFEQSVNESELAKFSSRVMAMDKAASNIKNHLEKLRIEKLKSTHKELNKKQQNSLSSIIALTH